MNRSVFLCSALLLLGCAGPQPQRMPSPPAPPTAGAGGLGRPSPPPPPAPGDPVPLADPRADLRYDVDLAVEVDALGAALLRADATVTNVSGRRVRLEHGACVVALVAYPDSARAGDPLWDSRRRATWPEKTPYGCPLPLIVPELAPGESYRGEGVGELSVRVPVAEVYGDSLPPGRYFFEARLDLNGDTVRVPAGSATLPSSRFHLGREYPLDGFFYRVAAEKLATAPGAFAVHVAVENAGMRSGLTRYVARECPVVLHAYRSEEAQRTAPPDPAWVSPRTCALTPEAVRPGVGEPRVFSRRFTAREVLGDSLPSGRYHVTAVVTLVDPREGRLDRRVWLDAGSFDLRR